MNRTLNDYGMARLAQEIQHACGFPAAMRAVQILDRFDTLYRDRYRVSAFVALEESGSVEIPAGFGFKPNRGPVVVNADASWFDAEEGDA